MKKLVITSLLLVFIILVAMLVVASWCLLPAELDRASGQRSLLPFLQLADHTIAENLQRCEGFEPGQKVSVADVLTSMIDQNQHYRFNRLRYGCDDERCVMSISDCQPWQSSECGQRFLMFSRHKGAADLTSLTCFDMP